MFLLIRMFLGLLVLALVIFFGMAFIGSIMSLNPLLTLFFGVMLWASIDILKTVFS